MKQHLGTLENAPFDVVLSDVNLPGESGVHLVEYIRSKWPTMRIALMSGSPLDGHHGADLELQKPVSATTLRDAIAALVSLPVPSGPQPLT